MRVGVAPNPTRCSCSCWSAAVSPACRRRPWRLVDARPSRWSGAQPCAATGPAAAGGPSGAPSESELPPAAANLLNPTTLASNAAAAIAAQSDAAVEEASKLSAAAASGPSTSHGSRAWSGDPSGLPTHTLYAGLAAAFGASGAAFAFLAPSLAAVAGAFPGGASAMLVPVLLGCFGGHLLRLASLCWFLKVGVDNQELHTWRYQRVNCGLALTFVVTALLQLVFITRASPLVTLPLLLLSAGAAAATGRIALAHWQHNKGAVSPLAVSAPGAALQLEWMGLVQAATSLAGGILTVLAVTAVGCGAAAVLGAGPSLGQGLGVVAYCRGLAAVGLLSWGLQCSALLESAAPRRDMSLANKVKLGIVSQVVMEEQAAAKEAGEVPDPLLVPPQRFLGLNLGLVVGLAVQVAWVVWGLAGDGLLQQGLLVGPDLVNNDPMVWGGLCWSLLLGGAYFVCLLCGLTTGSVQAAVADAFAAVSQLFHRLAGMIFVNWLWLKV